MTDAEAKAAEIAPCSECGGKRIRWRTPDGFNPFSAGGWNTIKAMYPVPCKCASLLQKETP